MKSRDLTDRVIARFTGTAVKTAATALPPSPDGLVSPEAGPSEGGGATRRNIPSDHDFDPRALKPMTKALFATSVALGHALTALRHVSRLKSMTISPDGMIGGRGYVMSIKDVRQQLYDGCESLSSIADTLYDEIQAPHWKPKLGLLGPNEAQDISRLIEEAQGILSDPTEVGEEEIEAIEQENDGALEEGSDADFEEDEVEDPEAEEGEEPFAEGEELPEEEALAEDEEGEEPFVEGEPSEDEVPSEDDNALEEEPPSEDEELDPKAEEPFEDPEADGEVDLEEDPEAEGVDPEAEEVDPEEETDEDEVPEELGKAKPLGDDDKDLDSEETPEEEPAEDEEEEDLKDEVPPEDEDSEDSDSEEDLTEEVPEEGTSAERFEGPPPPTPPGLEEEDLEEEDPEAEDAEEVPAKGKGKKFPKKKSKKKKKVPEELEETSSSLPSPGQGEETPAKPMIPSTKEAHKVVRRMARRANSSLPVDSLSGPRVDHLGPGEGTGPHNSWNPAEDATKDDWGMEVWDSGVESTSGMPSDPDTDTEAWNWGLGPDGDGGAIENRGEPDEHSSLPTIPGMVDVFQTERQALLNSLLPGDNQEPVARSDYFPGPKGHPVQACGCTSESELPAEEPAFVESNPSMMNTFEVTEDFDTSLAPYSYSR